MSTLETKKIEPLSGTSVTLGAAGDAVTMPAGVTVKTNTVKDAGGNTLWTSDGSGTLSSVNSALQGNMIFISSQTASSSASLEFTTGIDSTYDEYMIVYFGIVLEQGNEFLFDGSTDGGSNYGITKTTTYFSATHTESNNTAELSYKTGKDRSQSATFQHLTKELETNSDDGNAGIIHLFSPSNTTYVKHFYARTSSHSTSNAAVDAYIAGYFNTTSAIDALQFKQGGGNIESGTIAMYGIK